MTLGRDVVKNMTLYRDVVVIYHHMYICDINWHIYLEM